MSSPPYMQLYVAEYTADVQHLTCEQDGAYWRLLRAMWRVGGKLPNVPLKLARIVGLSLDRWAEIAPDVMALFVIRGGSLTHKRITRDLNKFVAKSEARKAAGKAGGLKNASKFKGKRANFAKANEKQNNSISESESDIESKTPETIVSGARATKPRASRRCPADWAPSPELIAYATELGHSPADVERETANIRDHEFKSPRSDWDAVARTWFRNATPKGAFHGPNAGAQAPSTPDPRRTNTESRRNAWSSLIEADERLSAETVIGGNGDADGDLPLLPRISGPGQGAGNRRGA